jgi:uncharacterized protein (DUF4415 family)
MKKKTNSKTGTDWERLKRMRAGKENIDTSDIPEADESFWNEASIVIPGGKTKLTIRIDTDVYQWFSGQGAGYQTRINAVLRSYMLAKKPKNAKHHIAAAG